MNATLPIAPAAVPAVPAAPAAAPSVAGQVAHSGGLVDGAQSAMSSWAGYFEALAILFFILAVLWLLVRLLRRGKGGFLTGAAAAMRVESRMSLGPKKWIVVARILDKRLVLGVTDQQITMLTELDADERPAPESKPSFASVLKGAKHPDPGGS